MTASLYIFPTYHDIFFNVTQMGSFILLDKKITAQFLWTSYQKVNMYDPLTHTFLPTDILPPGN